ncbi:hypothetical protein DIS24_g7212 [Lasiodiplodia hormozganensis]|uniref:Uncharacterized protein n=1 Tax=Lasiodiplodia hormozganensis TaxID=869390 RepID=A0AA39Y9S0_9PEZI|nr:hypothetical protein DIS24_g7212 [Lasiodiplodia hormozganensis]
MSSSPEAIFMDQVYIAILDVARKIKSRMGQQDTCSITLFKFIDVTTLLVKLQEEYGGTMLASSVSKWDEVESMKGLVNTWLCCIGDVLINGKYFSSIELQSRFIWGPLPLPASMRGHLSERDLVDEVVTDVREEEVDKSLRTR